MDSARRVAPLFVLNVHADYQCRHTGACCTAGWHIPASQDTVARATAALRRTPGELFDLEHPPEGAVGVLRQTPAGACVLFDPAGGNLCALQRAGGHDALPPACQYFPRVVLLDARGVHATLSHYCPTAARMLLRDDVGAVGRVEDPAGGIARAAWEGFDATATIPPFLRPGVAMDEGTTSRWEAFLIEACANRGWAPEDALAAIARTAEDLRAWTVRERPMDRWAEQVIGDATGRTAGGARMMSLAAAERLFRLAAASVPDGLPRPEPPCDLDAIDRRDSLPGWQASRRTVGRYLAARAFGAWSAYQGDGLRTQVAVLAVCLGVLRIEAIRQAAAHRRPLDSDLLIEAIRQADLLMVHLASSGDFVRSLAAVEHEPFDLFLRTIGLTPALTSGRAI